MSLSQTTGVGVDKGQLVADAAVLAGPAVLRDGAEWGEVTVTCTVRADVIAAGLLVRASSSGRDGLLVEADQSGVVTLSRVADGAVTQVAKSSRTDGFNKTKFHSLAVSLRGPDCSVTLDGKDKGTVTDDTLTRGGVGVYARDGQRSLWEDLTVTGADGGTLYTQVFDDPAAAGDFTARDMPESAPRPAAATARPAGCKDGVSWSSSPSRPTAEVGECPRVAGRSTCSAASTWSTTPLVTYAVTPISSTTSPWSCSSTLCRASTTAGSGDTSAT